jgi:hypothetical protein
MELNSLVQPAQEYYLPHAYAVKGFTSVENLFELIFFIKIYLTWLLCSV